MTTIPDIDREAHDLILNNVRINLRKYRGFDYNWLFDFWRERNFNLPVGGADVKVIDLEVDSEKSSRNDFENAITLYQKLNISPAMASSGAFWMIYSHSMLDYLRNRWPLTGDDDDDIKTITNKYLCEWSPSKRTLSRGGLSGLWWGVHMTVDHSREDPYELTREAMLDRDVISNILDRPSTLMNLEITKVMLEFSLKRRGDGCPLKRDDFRALMIYLNAIGGSVRIDAMNRQELKEIIDKFFEWRRDSETAD